MAGNAGYNAELYVTSTDTTPTASDLLCTMDLSSEVMRELLETTAHCDDGNRTRIAGLLDSGLSFSIVYDSASVPGTLVETAAFAGTLLYYHFRPTASATRQLKVPGLISGFSYTAGVGELVSADVTVEQAAAPTLTTS